VRIPAVPLHQRGCRQPNTQSDCLKDGNSKGLVKTDTAYGLVATTFQSTFPREGYLYRNYPISTAVRWVYSQVQQVTLQRGNRLFAGAMAWIGAPRQVDEVRI